MKDLFGKALLDFYHNNFAPPLLLHNKYGEPESIPIERYFIDQDQYSNLEIFALQQVFGRVLDIGAATGRHAIFLQDEGIDITAMDISPSCAKLMKEIGIKKILCQDIYLFDQGNFDTVLMLMNGLGIAGTINGLIKLFHKLRTIVTPEGQLIVDSSNINYLYDEKVRPVNSYFGELQFQYEYKGEFDKEFSWLYIDQKKLIEVASEGGWSCQIIYSDDEDAYLARLQQI